MNINKKKDNLYNLLNKVEYYETIIIKRKFKQ